MLVPQSLLFVPGSRPDRFAGALASDADLVCVDLEDAVPIEGKEAARSAALMALGDPRLALRINGLATKAGLADLLALAEHDASPPLLLLPMVESPRDLAIARAVLDDVPLLPLIETVAGLRAAHEIAAAPGVVGMMFGGGDLSAELGVALAWEPLLGARQAFVMACAGARVPAIDVPFILLDDADGLAEETRRAKALGFAGKAAIHPKQVAVINTVMRPSDEEVAEAKAALAAFDAAGGAAVRHQGRMLEAPVVARYRRLVAATEDGHA